MDCIGLNRAGQDRTGGGIEEQNFRIRVWGFWFYGRLASCPWRQISGVVMWLESFVSARSMSW